MEPREMGGVVNTSVLVAIVLGFHAIGWGGGESLSDQGISHVIHNNLCNSPGHL